MNHKDGNFKGADSLGLYYQRWQSDTTAKAILIIVHGFGEHSGRYMNVVDYMLPLGFTVYSFDHRGHGRSEGDRGHVQNWDEFREDLANFLKLVRDQEQDRPVFLLGHSMGGLVVLNYILHNPDTDIKSVISSGALLAQPEISPVLVTISKIFSRVWPGFSIDTKLDINSISRDPKAVAAYKEDPLVHSTASARFGTELTKTIEWTQAHASEFSKPLLMYHGESDSLVPKIGTQTFFDNVALKEKELHIYSDGFHEPHNDIDHKAVTKDLENWCNKYI